MKLSSYKLSFWIVLLLLTPVFGSAQINICGTVRNAVTYNPIEGAEIVATTVDANYVGDPDWQPVSGFAFTQVARYQVFKNGEPITFAGSKLSVWKDGELRGVTNIQFPPVGPAQFQLQMNSNLATEGGFTFMAYDAETNQVYEIAETHIFVANQTIGTPANPIPLNGYEVLLTYQGFTTADGTYCLNDVQEGLFAINAWANGYFEQVITDLSIQSSITQDFDLDPDCAYPTILNFPDEMPDACSGEEYNFIFSNVIVEDAIDQIWTIAPSIAGTIMNDIFSLNQDYQGGVVTISLVAIAEFPCDNAEVSVEFTVYPTTPVTCPNDFNIFIQDLPLQLSGALPEGGEYFGEWVENGIFNVQDPGDYTINYSYVDQNGCMSICEFTISVFSVLDLDLELMPGWNWISINVIPVEGDDLNSVLGDSGYNDGDLIQTTGGLVAEFFDGFGWFGNLETINPDVMYLMYLAEGRLLTVTGIPVDVAEPIVIVSGWNWIGYKPQIPIAINDALVSESFVDGDIIQTTGGSVAEYFDGFGWFGNLEELTPGVGYLLFVSNSGNIVYPMSSKQKFMLENNESLKQNQIIY